jgi:hypothetical protein
VTATVRRVMLAALLATSLTWLADSARYALSSGWNSDVFREWVVARYIVRHIDPWRISYETLRHNFGTVEEFRAQDRIIFEVHPRLDTTGVEGVLPEFGPPTSTYPPPGMFFFTLAMAWVPWDALLPFWLLVNGLALALLASLLRAWVQELAGNRALPWWDLPPYLVCLALMLWWPPVQEIVRTSQFGLIIALELVLGLRWMRSREMLSGLCFSLALFKPHIALPFLLLPLFEGRWRALLTVAVTQLAAWFAVAAWVRAPPLQLVEHWLGISPYMLQGAYTIQEFYNKLQLDPATGTLITLAFATACAGWTWLHRRADLHTLAGFVAFASVLWMYHERYDYVVLLLPLVAVAWWSASSRRDAARWALLAFVLLAAGLSDYAYYSREPLGRIVRWSGRLSLYALFIGHGVALRRAARRLTGPGPGELHG